VAEFAGVGVCSHAGLAEDGDLFALGVVMGIALQQILGTDKRNPYFTIGSAKKDGEDCLYVFFGAALVEIVPFNQEKVAYKLMLARLYNAGINAAALVDCFGHAYSTLKRWGDALKEGDMAAIVRVFSGQGAPKKVTHEIRSFVELRFPDVYADNKHTYSKVIREEIRSVFGTSLCAETLRPIFKVLKERLRNPLHQTSGDLDNVVPLPGRSANTCERGSEVPAHSEAKDTSGTQPGAALNHPETLDNMCERYLQPGETMPSQPAQPNRNHSLTKPHMSDGVQTYHHLGLLIFAEQLRHFQESVGDAFLTQQLAAVLAGAKNIEQSKLIKFNSLKAILGPDNVISSITGQRSQLSIATTPENLQRLQAFNARIAGAEQCTDFYFDPHTKHYTGEKNILKGWCSRIRFAEKIINMDFFHTVDGYPVYFDNNDNFHDMRERVMDLIPKFRRSSGIKEDQVLTFIIDRGIYSHDVLECFAHDEFVHLITWEKGYKAGVLDKSCAHGSFKVLRPRNCSSDLQTYSYEYLDRPWHKNERIRQIIVRATNPKGNTIEVSILTDDKPRDVMEIIKLMFSRWTQENDFKYLDDHFGINEITSYNADTYRELAESIQDKKVKSAQLIAIEMNMKSIRGKLKSALYKQSRKKKDDPKLKNQINHYKKQLKWYSEMKSSIKREESKLDQLIEKNVMKLNTEKKTMMDTIKIIARNIFYKAIDLFKKSYDNYRDDHVMFRNLTHSFGKAIFSDKKVDIWLDPSANYTSKQRSVVKYILANINTTTPMLPDGSGRVINLQLAKDKRFICD
jgi:hypothetical protein